MIADENLRAKMDRALATGASCISRTSDAGDSTVTIVGKKIWKEASEVKIPPKLPTVSNVNEWSRSVVSALVQASAYGDTADAAWFRESSDLDKDFDDLGDSGDERCCGLDSKRGYAISASASQHSGFYRVLGQKTRTMFKQHKLPTGRQMCAILCNQLKINKGLNTYYGIHDIGKLVWIGDSFAQISQFRDKWLRLIESLDPAVQIAE